MLSSFLFLLSFRGLISFTLFRLCDGCCHGQSPSAQPFGYLSRFYCVCLRWRCVGCVVVFGLWRGVWIRGVGLAVVARPGGRATLYI